jgi:diguanylate cyclase (GGDEF)-like protein
MIKPKLLIIDDSPMIQALVKHCLADDAIEVLGASDGVEGMKLAHTAKPDVILLDIEMPDPNGFEVCEKLKKDAETANIPILFLTHITTVDVKVHGLELGAADYVTKPFDQAELRARVRSSLRVKYMIDLLEQKARIDALTGIGNRAEMEYRLDQETSAIRRHGGTMSLMMVDIDEFKKLNDAHGHAFGDQVLRAVARQLAMSCRQEDTVYRYGGEEFVILSPRTSISSAVVLGERARRNVQDMQIEHREKMVPVTCSFGISEWGEGMERTLLERADAALYQAKRNGRNCVVSTQMMSGNNELCAATNGAAQERKYK